MPRRPKPPPRLILYTSHCADVRPDASTVAANAASPFCVGHLTSQRSDVQRAVAFITSMQAWFWCGYEYTASSVRAAPASAALTSPTLLAAAASSAVRPAFSICATSLLDVLAFAPSSHRIGS